jgi:WD40 repeat protein
LVATGSDDKSIILWKSSDGKEIRSFAGSNTAILQLRFNNQETRLLSVGANGKVVIWDINSGDSIKTFSINDDKIISASFNNAGDQIITGSEKSFILTWDITSGKRLGLIKAVPVKNEYWGIMDFANSKTVSYSKNGEYLISGTANNTAVLWDAKTLRELKKFHVSNKNCGGCYEEAVITPDSKNVIAAYSDSIQIFDIATGKMIDGIAQSGSMSNLTVSRDGKYVAVIQYGKAVVLDIKSKNIVFETDKSINATSLDFSPDNKTLVVGNESRTAEIYNISSGKKLISLKGSLTEIDERLLKMYWASLVNEAKLSPDGRFIAVGRTGNNAKLIDFKTGKIYKKLKGHNSPVISLCFSNDSKYIVTAGMDGKAILWDVESGNRIRDFLFNDSTLTIFSVDISDDDKLLATADWGGYVVIWDIETGKPLKEIHPHGGAASFHVKFSHNGLYVLSAGLDQKLKLLEVESG